MRMVRLNGCCTHNQVFTQSLESWKPKAATSQPSSSTLATNMSTLSEMLSEEELQRYHEVAVAVRPLLDWYVH